MKVAAAFTSRGTSGQVVVGLLLCLTAVGADRACFGFEENWASCPGLPACKTCVPVDCVFGAWNRWSYIGGCTKLCYRSRRVAKDSNACGEACSGAERETKTCDNVKDGMPTNCELAAKVDCTFGPWQAWLPKKCETLAQKTRKREILTSPEGDGAIACSGILSETIACGTRPLPIDCALTAWGPWSACDKACDGGYSYRNRTVVTEPMHRGTCPKEALNEVVPCNEKQCVADADCQYGAWKKWSKLGDTQLSTSLEIVPAKSHGLRCSGSLFTVKPAPPPPVADCAFTDWMEWSPCSKKCGVGQKSRSRSIMPWSGTGKCPLSHTQQVTGCNEVLCGKACLYSAWTLWGKCSTDCGAGTTTRSRTVATPGFDCDGALAEAEACSVVGPKCSLSRSQDCVWDQWAAWTACSATCGGGSSQRSRKVAVPPGADGKACEPLAMAEVKGCNPETCNPCVNGIWGTWEAWTPCSATCDNGIRSRKRTAYVEANFCGIPLLGKNAEYETCQPLTAIPCVDDLNCKLGTWTPWSACMPACFGVSERSRGIAVKATGKGWPCTDPTKQMKPCNPGFVNGTLAAISVSCEPRHHKDCALSVWDTWSICTAACSGTRQRLRRIAQLPISGRGCNDVSLNEVEGCNTTACKPTVCKDCKWSAWGAWGECAQCKGQQSRFRSVMQLPNYCGQACDARRVEESQACTGVCEPEKSCIWDEWSTSTPCPVPGLSQSTCGPQTGRRSRSMKLVDSSTLGNRTALARGGRNTTCEGFETTSERCSKTTKCSPTCSPVNCVFAPWSEWGGSSCSGLCDRSRAIATVARCGGIPCEGRIQTSKVCPKAGCETPVDCEISAWSFWTPCPQASDASAFGAQRSKSRTVITEPRFGGKLCEGALTMTEGCWEQSAQDCEWNVWAKWGDCTKTCGSGEMMRSRDYKTVVEFQGLPCKGDIKEVSACNTQDCPIQANAADCKWGAWTPWACGKDYMFMKSRSRARSWPSDAQLLGAPCAGVSEEMEPCDEGYTLPVWAPWGSCTKSCGRGQKTRTRMDMIAPTGGVHDDFPKAELPKTVPLSETVGCNTPSCEPSKHADCSLSDWEAWSPCSSSCGRGQQERARTHMNLRHEFGKGCTQPLMETQACNAVSGVGEYAVAIACAGAVDCAWGVWVMWSACNAPCGGGEKARTRAIVAAPLNGGKQCRAGSTEEVAPCNEEACNTKQCIDGTWAAWAPWTECSLTCRPADGYDGLHSRTRSIAQFPNECGQPLQGASKEVKSCDSTPCPSVNCILNAWQPWSGCGQQCDGFQKRHRTVNTAASGPKGKQCVGVMEETIGCKPCEAVTPVDCRWSGWTVTGGVSQYNGCTVSCGGGRVVKQRHIEINAKNGGKACKGAVKETYGCNPKTCPSQVPVDCKWAGWSNWTACDACGSTGQRTRSRVIATVPMKGGKNCETGDSEQITSCNVPCANTYCTWQAWQPWGNCTASCGNARKSRRRYLFSSDSGDDAKTLALPKRDDPQFVAKFAELQAHIESVNSSRWRDLSGAFILGGVAFLVALSAMRFSAIRQRHNSSKYSALDASGSDQDSMPFGLQITRSDSRQILPPGASSRDFEMARVREPLRFVDPCDGDVAIE